MKRFKEFSQKWGLHLLSLLSLIVGIIYLFKSFFKPSGIKPYSQQYSVDTVINIIDESFNRFGTFNSDHYPIFPALEALSGSELKQLHKDFGYRFYNSLTGAYKLLDTGGWGGLTERMDLNALYNSEFDENQKSRVKAIYKSKGISFPFI